MNAEIKILRWRGRYILQLIDAGVVYYAQRYTRRLPCEYAVRRLLRLEEGEVLEAGYGHGSSYWVGALSLYELSQ